MSESASISSLTGLRDRLAGCELVVLVDLKAKTCLLTSSVIDAGQERFDALCLEAAALLDSDADAAETMALHTSASHQNLFIRAGPACSEALCLVFDPGVALTGAVEASLEFLRSNL